MSLELLNRQRKIRLDVPRLKGRLEALMAAAGVADAEVDVILVSDRGIRVLNRRWRGLDRPTDCLSFPSEGGDPGLDEAPRAEDPAPERHLGDIVISVERAQAQGVAVASQGTPAERALEDEVAHLFAHSLLHLLGHDHESDAQARRMRAAERRLLRAAPAGTDPHPPRR